MEDDRISLAHGNGGRFMRELIEEIFARHLGKDELDTQAEPLRSQGVEVVVHVETQSGPEAVLGYAESIGADLIVVGNQGMTGKRRFILGSVPNAVSHHAPCSVLIVRTS